MNLGEPLEVVEVEVPSFPAEDVPAGPTSPEPRKEPQPV